MALDEQAKDGGSWLSMLKIELQFIEPDQMIEPESTTEEDEREGEHILGDATLETKKLWTYFCTLEERSTRAFIDAKYTKHDPDNREALMKKAAELKAKAEMARQILFLNLRDQFGIWNPNLGIGIRKGWKVVSFKSASNPLLDLLKGEL